MLQTYDSNYRLSKIEMFCARKLTPRNFTMVKLVINDDVGHMVYFLGATTTNHTI